MGLQIHRYEIGLCEATAFYSLKWEVKESVVESVVDGGGRESVFY